MIVDPLSEVDLDASVPAPELRFESISPNPLGATATIRFFVPRTEDVTLQLFDALGRNVAKIASKRFPAGPHEITCEMADLPGGVYICRLRSGGSTATAKLVRSP
jgi:hypothetical protein